MKAWFSLAIFLSACSFDSSGLSVDGGGAGDAALPDAAWCNTANYPACRPDNTTLDECVSGVVQTTVCDPLTCIGPVNTAKCGTVMPSNGINMSAVTGAGATTVPAGQIWAVRANTGEITRCGATAAEDIVIRPAVTGLHVGSGIRYESAASSSPSTLGFLSLLVEQGAEVRFHGGSAIALVTATSVRIEGQLTISGGGFACELGTDRVCGRTVGNQGCPGSGGFWGGASEANGSGPGSGGGQAIVANGTGFEFGGGGGGFGATGGRGGPDGGNNGPAGGTSYGNTRLEPLVGGAGGAGGGLASSGTPGTGGGGGGAIQLTSFETLVITVSGRIKATGAGGGGSIDAGAGGGGAGGAILLEAPSIQIASGQLSTNGGGGAGGGPMNTTAGADGDFGSARASGGAGLHGGGTGGSLGNLAGGDGLQGDATDGTGGGGGAAGRIYFRSRAGGFDITTVAGDISPQESARATDLVQ